jgi:predicted ATPase
MAIVGRERALAEVVRRLGESRLVTITGPGGIGKTTLADAIASSEGHRYPLGTRRVDLTLVDGEHEVAPALAAQLGFGSFRALLDSPTDAPALVVVDNCEHVLDAASEAVAELLGACRSPTVLATSRSPLGLTGESVIVLGPLELPATEGGEPDAPAVQLFLQRARECGGAISTSELDAVGRLCRVLDGVPLAIEIAAARSRVLTPTELLDRLGDLDTLRRPRSRGPVRHRSLRDTIAWSYALLDGDDQRFFDRLAVLSGPFTIEDAHAVAGDGDIVATIDRVDRLVADSLLATTSVAGVTYHRQLELVRSYARERLVDAGDWDATWERFVNRVTERSVRLVTDSSPAWDREALATLLSRVDHHLTVLRWCVERDERPARSFILVSTLWGVVHQGRLDDVAPLAERVLARWDDPTLPGWADAAATTATCRYLAGRPNDAIDLAWRALEHADSAHYAPCTLRRVIGHARVAIGDLDGAVTILSDAIDIACDRVPALAMEMVVSRAELVATLVEGTADPRVALDEQLVVVREVAVESARSGSVVNEIWARSVEATLVGRIDRHRSRDLAAGALAAARAALYPAAETVNLHTLASLSVDDGDLTGAARLTRQLIDGLVSRGAESELRNGLRLASVILERAGDPAWAGLAATARSLPVVSLFSLPGHERHELPEADGAPMDVRGAVTAARRALDSMSREAAIVVPGPDAGTSAGPSEPSPGPDLPIEDSPNRLRREGDLWTITYDGATVHLRTSKGLADIARLLAAPGTDVHCLDLAGAVVEDRSTGEVIDDRARREYEQRVRELYAEIEEAEADADLHRADRARAELDAIVDHLTAALGLGGRARRHTDSVERARSAVTQRIRSTVKRLRSSHPSLAAHLDASIQTGIYCRYRPERPTEWSIVGPTS